MSLKKKDFTDKEIIQALVRDLVQFAHQAKTVMDSASVPVDRDTLENTIVLNTMIEEILTRYTQAKDEKLEEIKEEKDEEKASA